MESESEIDESPFYSVIHNLGTFLMDFNKYHYTFSSSTVVSINFQVVSHILVRPAHALPQPKKNLH